jgi:HAD superfamily phosphatase (TIGR01668 family)
MSWGKLLQPDLVLGGPILGLTPDVLQTYHLEGLVLDVDDTLVPTSTPDIAPDLHAWVETIRPIAPIWLVSNNLSERRISRIAQSFDLPYILGARKPSRRKLRQAAESMQLPVERVAMVGDRLFTDVLAGNRLGMFTILVEPMVDPLRVDRRSRLRAIEVWISQKLGATLMPNLGKSEE